VVGDPAAVSDLILMLTEHPSALRKALPGEKDAVVRAVIAKFVP
jgi:hypothetical protein